VEYIADQILIIKKGSLLMEGTVPELTAHASGFVWRLVVSSEQAEQYEKMYCKVNLRHINGQVEFRIISENELIQRAQPQEPTLEDLCLYCFGSEQTAIPGN